MLEDSFVYYALGWSPDVEVRWRATTDFLFQRGVTGVRFLPVHLLLGVSAHALPEHRLDKLRRSHPVTTTYAAAAPQLIDRQRWEVLLECPGLAALRAALSRDTGPAPSTVPRSVTMHAPREAAILSLTPGEAACTTGTDSAVPLPAPYSTAALWLTVYRIHLNDTQRWEAGGRWGITYRRRLTVRPTPPDSDLRPLLDTTPSRPFR